MEASRPLVVLHLEPDRAEAAMLSSVLRDVWPETFCLRRVGSLVEAEERLREGGVDCVLADPAEDEPARTLERLRALAPVLPVVVLTAQADEGRALRAVRAGAQDVLAKSADGGMVGRALLYAVERTARRETGRDAVTGLWDRRRFVGELDRALAHTARYGTGGALLLVELDGPVGDADLGAVAAVLTARLRRTDVIGRIGRARFGVILPHVDEGRARHVAHALGAMLADEGRAGAATLGTTPLPGDATGAEELLGLAVDAVTEVGSSSRR